MADLPPASEKLRTVLDYVPCEACLARRVEEQELLCSICHRLDRQIGVRVAVTTTVMLDRPSSAPAGPVLIPPAPMAEVLPSPLPSVEIRYLERGERAKKRKGAVRGVVEVFVEPIEEAQSIAEVSAPTVPPAEPEPQVEWQDVASFEPPSDAFEYVPAGPTGRSFATAEAPTAPARPPEDDYVFRPPTHEDPLVAAEVAAREPELEEDWMPSEEVPVHSESSDAQSRRWARPETDAAEETPVLEEAPLAPAQEEDEPILDALVVEEDEAIQETTMVEPEPSSSPSPPPSPPSDLWRLRGFDASAERALAAANIKELSHLSGHDATELAERTGLDARRLAVWVDVADLKEEVGVPLDAAIALVAAGIAGPKGLRAADPEDVVAKVEAFGGSGPGVQLKDVKRWKRRA